MASAHSITAANGHHWTVLVVEDETIIAGAIEDLLAEMGASAVSVARTEGEARALLGRGRFDLAVVDWQLGRLDAAALLRHLTEREIPAIVVTGRHPDDVVRHLPAGVALVAKPFTDESLAGPVRALLALRSPRRPED